MSMNPRRKFLIAAGATAGAAGIAGALLWHQRSADEHAAYMELPPFRDPEFPNPLRLPASEGMYGVLDAADAFTMVAKPVRHALLPGTPAPMLAYEVEHHGKTLLNPVLRVRTGTHLRIKFWNALEETSIIHWHGLKSTATMTATRTTRCRAAQLTTTRSPSPIERPPIGTTRTPTT
jgi:FtsP/CotA-like multicopper oxidase with cupredoxin domain